MHIVYRTPYIEGNHKFHTEIKGETLLEGIRNLWQFYAEDSEEFYGNVKKYIGTNLYGFWCAFREYIDSDEDFQIISRKTPPSNQKELIEFFNKCYYNSYYYNVEDYSSEDIVQIRTDDDELELAYYFFTEKFARENPEITAYLVHPTWKLPEQYAENSNFNPKVQRLKKNKNVSEKTTYVVVLSGYGGDYLNEWRFSDNIVQLEGIRLDELNYYLKTDNHEILKTFNGELWNLRTQVRNDSIYDTFKYYSNIPAFYLVGIDDLDFFDIIRDKDFRVGQKYIEDYYQSNKDEIHEVLEDRHRGFEGEQLKKGKFQFSEHLIQASIHAETWAEHPVYDIGENIPFYEHWIVFDDLWATANPNLAHSILNYANQWNIK